MVVFYNIFKKLKVKPTPKKIFLKLEMNLWLINDFKMYYFKRFLKFIYF